jgi:hypothetical protein
LKSGSLWKAGISDLSSASTSLARKCFCGARETRASHGARASKATHQHALLVGLELVEAAELGLAGQEALGIPLGEAGLVDELLGGAHRRCGGARARARARV